MTHGILVITVIVVLATYCRGQGQGEVAPIQQLYLCEDNAPVISTNVIIKHAQNAKTYTSLRTVKRVKPSHSVTSHRWTPNEREGRVTAPRDLTSTKPPPPEEGVGIASHNALDIETTSGARVWSEKRLAPLPEETDSAKGPGIGLREAHGEQNSSSEECQCLIEASHPSESYMAVNVQFVNPEGLLANQSQRAETRESPTTPGPLCPKLYLVYDGKSRQELVCLGLRDHHATLYRLPRLRLHTLAIHLEKQHSGSDVRYAAFVINVTSIGVGMLRASCHKEGFHHTPKSTSHTDNAPTSASTPTEPGRGVIPGEGRGTNVPDVHNPRGQKEAASNETEDPQAKYEGAMLDNEDPDVSSTAAPSDASPLQTRGPDASVVDGPARTRDSNESSSSSCSTSSSSSSRPTNETSKAFGSHDSLSDEYEEDNDDDGSSYNA